MRLLVTPREAAEALFVSYPMIGYWIRKGRLAKHPTMGKHYLVDLDEARRAANWNPLSEVPDNLVTIAEAADMIGVVPRQISYYAKMGYVKKHYVLGSSFRYLVDVNEVLAQPKRIREMLSSEERKSRLRQFVESQPRDSRNRYFVSTNEK